MPEDVAIESGGTTSGAEGVNPATQETTNGSESGAASQGILLGSNAEQPQNAPASYDLTIPEGMRFQPGQMQAFEAQARELGLSGEQAQKLLDAAHANQSAVAQQQAAQIRQWAEESKNDPEIGGARFAENVGIANAALKRFDQDGRITRILNETGYGNHPDVVRIFARIGRSIAEDRAPAGAAGAQAPELPLSDRLYPNWNVKK